MSTAPLLQLLNWLQDFRMLIRKGPVELRLMLSECYNNITEVTGGTKLGPHGLPCVMVAEGENPQLSDLMEMSHTVDHDAQVMAKEDRVVIEGLTSEIMAHLKQTRKDLSTEDKLYSDWIEKLDRVSIGLVVSSILDLNYQILLEEARPEEILLNDEE